MSAKTELAELRQAVWEARAILGFDNDGDPTPDALTFPTLAVLVKRDAAEFRKDYDGACDEATKYRGALEAIVRRSTPHEGDTDADRKRDLYHIQATAQAAIKATQP